MAQLEEVPLMRSGDGEEEDEGEDEGRVRRPDLSYGIQLAHSTDIQGHDLGRHNRSGHLRTRS